MASILFNIPRICSSQFKCKYLKKEKLFLDFLFHFCNLHQILNAIEKKMMVIANMIPKLETVENFVTPLCRKCRFGTRSDSQHAKVPAILVESA